MPSSNLVRLALRRLEAVDAKTAMQRHISLLVARAYLDGAIECSLQEATSVQPWELEPTPADFAEAQWLNRLAWQLQTEVGLRMYGADDTVMAQWMAASGHDPEPVVSPDQLRLEAVL